MDLKNKVAVEGTVNRPLGRLCWYTVPESVRVSRPDLEDAFSASGVDERHLPEPIRAVDAFRRATSAVQKTGLPQPDGTLVNLLVREVVSNDAGVVRQVVKETVDQRNVRLSYDPAAEIVLDRKSCSFLAREFFSDGAVAAALEEARRLYEEYKVFYDGDAVRRMIKAILSSAHPTAVRPSGGVYFVPEKRRTDLEALERLSKALGCEFFTLPVVDSESTREMVEEKFKTQIARAVSAMAEALKSGNLTSAKTVSLVEEAKGLLGEIGEYERLLEKELRDLRADVEVVKAQMLAVLDAAA